MITKLRNKIVEIFIKYLQLSKPIEKRKWKPLLPLNLQLFAGDEDDKDDDLDEEDKDDDEDDGPSLDELLKDPKFKKQYNERFKQQLGKRLKKFDGIDPEEYRRLKQQADKKKDKEDKKDEDDELETLKSDVKEKEKKLLRADRREKRAAIKEFAVDNGYNQKLLARLMDVDAVELDEDGEPVNLDELFEEIQGDFPEYFSNDSDDEDDEDDEDQKKSKSKTKKASSYKPGSSQKGNKKKKVDVYARGAERAKQRHKKEE